MIQPRLMSSRASRDAVTLLVSAGAALTACGGDEIFVPQLATSERLIDTSAVARLSRDDQRIAQLVAVGDLDGDGVDDAIVRTDYTLRTPDDRFPTGTNVYVLYGGSTVTGQIDLASLPQLTGGDGFGLGVAAVDDVDGDGLADVLITAPRSTYCAGNETGTDDQLRTGAYLVYGSHTRLTGATPIGDASVFLRDPVPCSSESTVTGLGDLDGDGKADFAIARADLTLAEVFVYYGRAARPTGVVDLRATADAVISGPAADGFTPGIARVGDIDGDGHADFMLRDALSSTTDLRLVRGSATRLTGNLTPEALSHTVFVGDAPCFDDVAAALGDLDGDGADDFALATCPQTRLDASAPMEQRVFYGRTAGFPAQVSIDRADATIHLAGVTGSQLAGGDVDGDGIRDLVIGDSGLHGGNGGVHVRLGDGTRLPAVVDPGAGSTTFVGTSARGTQCGYVLSPDCVAHPLVGVAISVGDLTGDHHADVLVLAPSDQFASAELGVHGSSLAQAYVLSPGGTNR
jgi:hypothetical protein